MRVFTGGSAIAPVTVPASEPIRVWHLLTHTAGLTYGFHHAHPVDGIYRKAGFEWGAPADQDLADVLRALGRAPARVRAGFALELLGGDRRARPARRGGVGPDAGRVLRRADLRTARHDRHVLLGARGGPRPAGRALRPPPGHPRDPPLRRHGGGDHEAAGLPVRWRRAGVDRARLPPLRRDAPAGRRARRRAAARPPHRPLHGHEPPARRRGPRGLRSVDLRGDDLRRCRVRARVRGRAGPRSHQGALVGRRDVVGRRRLDRLLRRPGRGHHRGVPHPAAPVEHLRPPFPAQAGVVPSSPA